MTKQIKKSDLYTKIKAIFESCGTEYIRAEQSGLSRSELRKLERLGIVESIKTISRKYTDRVGTIQYVYRLRRNYEKEKSNGSKSD